MARRLTLFILLALLFGIAFGFALNRSVSDPAALVTITDDLSILTDMFLRLIKMIIAPLVFATLVAVGPLVRFVQPYLNDLNMLQPTRS